MKNLINYINESSSIINTNDVINAIKKISNKFSLTKSSIGYETIDSDIQYASALRYNARSKKNDQIFIFLYNGDVIRVMIHAEPFSTSKSEINDLLKNTDINFEIKEESYTSGIASTIVPYINVFIADGKKNYINVVEIFANFYSSKIK